MTLVGRNVLPTCTSLNAFCHVLGWTFFAFERREEEKKVDFGCTTLEDTNATLEDTKEAPLRAANSVAHRVAHLLTLAGERVWSMRKIFVRPLCP